MYIMYGVYMIRKQLYLTPEIDRVLKIKARRLGKTTAEVVRKILEKNLEIKKQKEENPAAVLLRLAANAGHGQKDLSTNLYSYLYGDKSSKYGKDKRTTTLTKAEGKRLERFLRHESNKTSRRR